MRGTFGAVRARVDESILQLLQLLQLLQQRHLLPRWQGLR
jgi:hypothetical protein